MKNLFLSVALFFIAAYVSSCAAYLASRQTKKDDKAISYAIIHKQSVMKPVADIWNSLNPIEQKVVYVKGRDSVRVDSIPYDRVRDSIISKECPSVNFDSLRKTWTKVIYHNSVDTISIPNTNSIRTIYSLQYDISNMQGRLDQQKLELQSSKSKNGKLVLWIIGLSISLLVIIGLVIYKTIKKI